MEHYNPILGSEPNGQKFITCGEIMLRLTPPNYEKIRMASSFEASYGGSEANIALALANLGVDSTFFSVVPNNSLGKSAVRWLRSNDVHCTPMILTEPNETPSNRLGTYYLETGYGIRASKVIYDRKHSAITEYDFSQVDLDALLDGYDWLHLSGITPALGPNCRGLIIDMLKVAKKKGLTVSFDGNFRSTLWSWEEARDFCTECLPYVDVLLGIEPYHLWKDENDHSKGDWKDGVPLQHIHVGQALGAEVPCLLPSPQGGAEVAVKAHGQALLLGNLQHIKDQAAAVGCQCRGNAAEVQPVVALQQGVQIHLREIVLGTGTQLPQPDP